jgi:PAS domain S-box-containing protein
MKMPFIARLPLRRKLMLLIMFVSMLGLMFVGTIFGLYERYRMRLTLVEDLAALSRLVGDRSTAALLFDDATTATENLTALRVKPEVIAACIYNAAGTPVATFVAQGRTVEFPPVETGRVERFGLRAVELFDPIVLDGNRIGTVYILADLGELLVLWRQYLLATGFFILCAAIGAYSLSSRLQHLVTDPLMAIAETARQVTQRKDYSVRAENTGDADVSAVVEALNEMLGTIESQNKRLGESELKYRELVEHANSIILRWRADGSITFLNEFGQRFFGYSAEEMTGRHVIGTIVPQTGSDGRDLQRLIAQITDDPAAFGQNVNENMLRDGTRVWISWTNRLVRDERGRVAEILSVGTDVTERRRAEEAIRQLNADLERRVAERTAELAQAKDRAETADRVKSAFLATMSHELRTPLNSIIGFTGIILDGLAGPLNPEQERQLAMVQNSARHLLALINDVLDISKIEAAQLKVTREPMSVPAAVANVVGIVRPLAEKKGLTLQVEAAPEIGTIRSDPRRVEQVLLNLINNAIKFTEQGGVTLRVGREQGAAAPRGAGGVVRFDVRDTGIGLKPESLATLFQPFKQVDSGLSRSQEGTGLGLAICRRLAELMGGSVTVESEWGRGSVFTFRLPENGEEKP